MRILLTGASGQLGAYLIDHLAASDHQLVAWSGSAAGQRGHVAWTPVNLAEPDHLAAALDHADPDAILHTAAISSPDAARQNPALASAVNVEATRQIAAWCRQRDRRLLLTSTDMVFDGTRPWAREDHPTTPAQHYGRTKRDGEQLALDLCPSALVVRLPLLYGPSRSARTGFYDRAVAALQRAEPQTFFEDEFRTPLQYATAAIALLQLLETPATGLLHVAGRDRLSRFELMRRIACALGFDPALIRANRLSDAVFPEPRPADCSLDTTRLATLLPDLDRPPPDAA